MDDLYIATVMDALFVAITNETFTRFSRPQVCIDNLYTKLTHILNE